MKKKLFEVMVRRGEIYQISAESAVQIRQGNYLYKYQLNEHRRNYKKIY